MSFFFDDTDAIDADEDELILLIFLLVPILDDAMDSAALIALDSSSSTCSFVRREERIDADEMLLSSELASRETELIDETFKSLTLCAHLTTDCLASTELKSSLPSTSMLFERETLCPRTGIESFRTSCRCTLDRGEFMFF